MSLTLARWTIERHTGRWLLGSVAVFRLSMIAFGPSSRQVAWSIAGAGGLRGADMVSVAIHRRWCSSRHRTAMRGVSAVNSVFIGASNQLGEFEREPPAGLVPAQ